MNTVAHGTIALDPQLTRILSRLDEDDGSLTFEPDVDHFVALPGLDRALAAGLVRLDHGSGWGLEKVDIVLTRKGKSALGYPPGALWRIWFKLFPKATA